MPDNFWCELRVAQPPYLSIVLADITVNGWRMSVTDGLHSMNHRLSLSLMIAFNCKAMNHDQSASETLKRTAFSGCCTLPPITRVKVASMVWRCQLGLAATGLICLCRPVSSRPIWSSRSVLSAEMGSFALSSVYRTTLQLCRAALVVSWARRYEMASILRCKRPLTHP